MRESERWLFCGVYIGGDGGRRRRHRAGVCVYGGGCHADENRVVMI